MGSDNEGTTSVPRTCLNALNTLLGIGILTTPYALSQGGWISLTILLSAAIICFYTGILLKRCFDVNRENNTYPGIAGNAFGPWGKMLVSVLLYLELYLVSVEMLILEGDNMTKLFPHGIGGIWRQIFGVRKGFIVLTCLIVLPTTWVRNMGLLAYLSAGGIIGTMIVLVSVVSVGMSSAVGFHEKGQVFNLKSVPTAMSLFIFCFGGHGVFPTLYNSMENKNQFSKVLMFSFVMSTIGYGSMAIFGYLMYGEHLNDQVTLNLPLRVLGSQIAIYTTLISPLTKYAITVNPISSAIDEMISSKKIIIGNILRTALVASALLIALVVPKFGFVMAFVGSFLTVLLSIILPCACYLKLHHFSQGEKVKKIIIWAILLLGLTVGIIGTFSSVQGILK